MSAQFRINSAARLLAAVDVPFVVFTARGYQAALMVRDVHTGEQGHLLLGALSLSQGLRELEVRNGGWDGLTFIVRKVTNDKMSPYEVIADS
jgi:hypothetical protein